MATSNTAADTSAFEETANRIRELNEKLIQLAKESGQSSLDTYEKALQSMVNFEKYFDETQNKLDLDRYPALRLAKGYEVILEHGDSLFMPAGYWHHMEYLDSGFAMSLRALNSSVGGKLKGLWNIAGMRNIDTLMKKSMPHKWYEWKERKIFEAANKELALSKTDI